MEENWGRELTRVSSARLPPGHPCLEYLAGQGLTPGTSGVFGKAFGGDSPLSGKRWYLPVTVRGRRGEFLIDTGASHSFISKKFYSLLPDRHEDLLVRVSACTADGSSMQTFGKTFMPISVGGGEFVFSPIIADTSDEGSIGLDFAALYGAVLDPATGQMRIKNPYGVTEKCVLKHVSGVASVVQTVKIPVGHTCDVLCSGLRT
mgnify:FL=1